MPDTDSQKILAAVGAQLQPAGQVLIGGQPESKAAATESPAQKRPAEAAVKAESAQGKPAKRRGPGRPRKERLDAPLISHMPPPQTPPTPEPAALQLPAAPQIASVKTRTMTDVRKTDPAPAPRPQAVAPPAPRQSKQEHRHRTPGMQVAAWKALGQGQNYLQALPFALAALLPAGIVWANLSHLAGLNAAHLHQADLGLAAQLALALLAAWTVGLISLPAVLFGAARRHDQRGKNSGLVWARVGAAACLKSWAVVICQAVLALPILASVAALVRFGGQDLGLPPQVNLVAVFLMSAIAGYLLAGTAVAALLGLAGVTLGNLSVWQAMHLGWNGWRRHPELLINWLLVKLPGAVLAVAWVWSLLPIDAASLSDPAWLAQAAAGVVVTVLILTIQSGAAAEAAYRHVVTADRFGQAGSFLMGRSPGQIPRFALTPLVLTLLAAGGVAAIQLTVMR